MFPEYVKICPSAECGTVNAEGSKECSECGAFLGMVTPTINVHIEHEETLSIYGRHCPNAECNKANPQDSDKCSACGGHLESVPTAPAHIDSDALSGKEEERREVNGLGCESVATNTGIKSSNSAQFAHQTFYLQLIGGTPRYTVHSGDVMGRSEFGSEAHIQLTGIRGLDYVHQNHCRFDFGVDGWRITALEQPHFEEKGRPPNPTLVNHHTLKGKESHLISSGDQITLSGVSMIVHIP